MKMEKMNHLRITLNGKPDLHNHQYHLEYIPREEKDQEIEKDQSSVRPKSQTGNHQNGAEGVGTSREKKKPAKKPVKRKKTVPKKEAVSDQPSQPSQSTNLG